MGFHRYSADNHVIEAWPAFANTAARDAGTYVPGDVGRIAYVTATGLYYRLIDDSPLTWQALGGGTTDPKRLCLTIGSSLVPTATGAVDEVLRVPHGPGGAVLTFNLTAVTLRKEATAGATSTTKVQKSASGGAFTPTDIGTVSVTSGNLETTVTSSLGSVSSGDLVRVNWTALGGAGGAGSGAWTVTIEGEEP